MSFFIFKRINFAYLILGALLILVLITNNAHADLVNSGANSIVDAFRTKTTNWGDKLLPMAKQLFWLLAFIEFAWAMIGLAFRSNDLGDWVSTIINQIMFISLFYWFLINSTSFGKDILNSFRIAGEQAGGASLAPTQIFNNGIEIVSKMLDSISITSPIDSLSMAIASIVVIACFALIAAFTILAIVESYFVIYAGILFMGFGGSRWTKDYAVKTLQYAVSVGAKIFVLALILGIANSMIGDWVTAFNAKKNLDVILIIGCSIVFVALVKIIPDLVQGLINGTSMASGGALTSAAAAVGGATLGAASSVVGTSMATKSAGSLASEQLKTAQANGTAPQSAMGTAGFLAKSMAQNLGGSASENLGSQFRQSTFGGKMASNMDSKTKDMASSRKEAQQDASMESKSTDSQTQSSDAKSKDNSQENTIS